MDSEEEIPSSSMRGARAAVFPLEADRCVQEEEQPSAERKESLEQISEREPGSDEERDNGLKEGCVLQSDRQRGTGQKNRSGGAIEGHWTPQKRSRQESRGATGGH